MKVRWIAGAKQGRADIVNYIAIDNPRATLKIDQLFSDAAAKLAMFPKMGKQGGMAGTREWMVHESYRLIYEIDQDTVWVVALVHTARQWPPAE